MGKKSVRILTLAKTEKLPLPFLTFWVSSRTNNLFQASKWVLGNSSSTNISETLIKAF